MDLTLSSLLTPYIREKGEDIPLLTKFYAAKFSKRHVKDIKKIPKNTMEALKNYSWLGIVRESINIIERAVGESVPGPCPRGSREKFDVDPFRNASS